MKIRKLLAATGVAVALTPAALAAVIMAAHPKDGSVLKAIQEAVGTELTLDQLQGLIGVEPASAPAASEQVAAESDTPAADGKLARVITGSLDSTRVGYYLADLMRGDEPDPFSGSSSAEVVAALGDPESPQRQSAVYQASGGSTAVSGAIGGRAVGGAGGGAGAGAAGGSGGEQAASLQGSDEVLALAATGPAPEEEAGAVLPMAPPVEPALGPVEQSVAGLDHDRRGDPMLRLGQRSVLAMPLPTSLWLFLAAMVGLVLLGRSRAAG